MTDEERFELVLGELGGLLLRLGDLAHHVVLVGGLALAVEARARGSTSGSIAVDTDVGLRLDRGFSLDIDLLYSDAGSQSERLPEILRGCRFVRQTSTRWVKELRGVTIPLDLLAPDGMNEDLLPTPMTPAPAGELAASRTRALRVEIGGRPRDIPVPDAVAFLAMKLAARPLRPDKRKDAFDLFAYASLLGPDEIRRQLAAAGALGREVAVGLAQLFATTTAPGVLDVLAYEPALASDERDLLARAVVEAMAQTVP